MTDQLDLLRDLIAEIREGRAEIGAPTFFFSACNAVPKLMLGKARVFDGYPLKTLASPDLSSHRIPCCTSKTAVHMTAQAVLAARRTALLVPKFSADALRRGFAATPGTKEFIVPSSTLIDLPGSKWADERKLRNRAWRRYDIADWEGEKSLLPALLEINRAWYRNAAGRMFRTYDKASIDWLLENFDKVREVSPSAVVFVAMDREDGGKPVAFQIAEHIAGDYWQAYTYRYLPGGGSSMKGIGWALLEDAAKHMDRQHGATRCNHGTADTPALRAHKAKLTDTHHFTYQLAEKA